MISTVIDQSLETIENRRYNRTEAHYSGRHGLGG